MTVADAHDKSGKYNKENLNLAKRQSKAGKDVLNVIKAQNKGNTLSIVAAKAKLKLSRMFGGSQDEVTKSLYEQYDVQQKSEKVNKKLTQELIKQANAAENIYGSMLEQFGVAGGIMTILSKVSGITDAIGGNFGAIGVNNEQFKSDMLAMNVEATKLGKGTDEILSNMNALTGQFGFSLSEAKDMAVEVSDTAMALGLSEEESSNLLGTLTKIGGLSKETASDFAKQTALLASAEGVAPQQVMKDIANSSEAIAAFTGATPEHLAKAAIQAAKLGLKLDDLAKSAEGMLDFQSSLNAEVEAQIMLGRDINLQKARELALAGKMDDFAVEITKQVGSQAEFEKLNVLQKQSLARAMNMEVGQLTKIVMNQDKVRTLGEAISEQPGLEEMIGEEAMSNMAKTIANLKAVGAQLIQDIGPTVAKVAGGIGEFVKYLQESKALLPTIKGIIGFMAAKSLISAVSGIYTSFATIPAGLGIPLAVAAVGTLMATINSLPSFQGLEGGKTAMIKSGAAIAHAGENITRTEDMRNMNKGTEEKLDKLATILTDAFGIGGSAAKQIGKQVGRHVEILNS
jgi:plasmid maintenance system antidote protein VapI